MYIDNPNFDGNQEDMLYHFGLSTKTHDFVKLFGDVKFVCCGGTAKRMEKMASMLNKELYGTQSPSVTDLSQSDRYSLFKVGPVLCVNHGIGMPSMSVMLHELFKLLHHAGCKDVLMFRIGTSGGLGIPPGTIIMTEHSLNALLEPDYKAECVGKEVRFPTVLDSGLRDELYNEAVKLNLPVMKGNTVGTDDFYEAQGRLDGAFCCFNKAEKMAFFEKAHSLGVKNFEMESTVFAAMTHRAGVKAAIMCVTLLNRMESDQVTTPPAILKAYEARPCQVLTALIKKKLAGQRDQTSG